MSTNEASTSQNFMDRFADTVVRLSAPLAKLAQLPFMRAVQHGFAATLPILMFGSVFLIVQSAVTGNLGFTIFPSLAQYSSKILVPYQMASGFLGFYACVAIGIAYAENLGIENRVSAALIILSFFFFINYDGTAEGLTDLTAFSSSGAFAAMVTAFLSIRMYKFFIDKNITIKLPDVVPPMIANAFTDLIPTFVILGFAWTVRTALGFNFTNFVLTCLTPILKFGDSGVAYTLNAVCSGVFWSVGIHWENMASGIVTPLCTTLLAENQAAFAAGTALKDLPHIWAQGANMMSRACTNYPMLVYLLRSKVPGFKELGRAATIPVLFCVCEPLTFGVPVVMNPYMMIPLILTNLTYAVVTWGAYSLKLVNRVYASAPWASPTVLNMYLSTGDWHMVFVIALIFVLGMIIYYPFFKAYEKHTLEEIAKREAEASVE